MLTVCIDATIIVNIVQRCLNSWQTSLTIYPLCFVSVLQGFIFLLPAVRPILKVLYSSVSQAAKPGVCASICQSPFRMASLESIEDLGPEFRAEPLVQEFNRIWMKCKHIY